MSCSTLVMELNGIVFLAGFLMNIKLSKMSPSRLPCDDQMISKYVNDSKSMENQAKKCKNVSLLREAVLLPLVDFTWKDWSTKPNSEKGMEILLHLKVLLEAVHVAHMHQQQGCLSNPLNKLFQTISDFQLIVKNLLPQERALPLEDMPLRTRSERRVQELFRRYCTLMRGKISFFLYNVRETFCKTHSR
ncbi:erythropoietin-like isoform X2 [Rhinatrema bivittatum]|uniref:erythropoietin-like isoform X2 n=1 Tax=Rhinatrema bivittatum TaxID=194408 RepID=UPI00112B48BC|nr:erythropoietin-like isoform X2 [Rhinatrema bivittatum]